MRTYHGAEKRLVYNTEPLFMWTGSFCPELVTDELGRILGVYYTDIIRRWDEKVREERV